MTVPPVAFAPVVALVRFVPLGSLAGAGGGGPGALLQWQSPQMLGVALLVAVGAAVATALLYPAQVRTLPAAWRIALPLLRWLALAALAVSVARPVAERALEAEEQGAIVVLVDRSRSMGARDAQRPPAALVALADGLGRLAPERRKRPAEYAAVAEPINRLPALLENVLQPQRELEFAQLQGKENPGAQRRLSAAAAEFADAVRTLSRARAKLKAVAPGLAASLGALERLPAIRSPQWAAEAALAIAAVDRAAAQYQSDADDRLYRTDPEVKRVCDELAGLSRLELVERALADPEGGLLAHLPPGSPLYGYTIGPGVAPLPLRAQGEHGQPVRRLLVEPAGPRSDLTGGLREVMDQLRHRQVEAIVLLSDGQQVGAEATIASSPFGGATAPVFAVSPAPAPGAAARGFKDLAIERVAMPPSVFVGETLTLAVHVRHPGVPRDKVPPVAVRIGPDEYTAVARAPDRTPDRVPERGPERAPEKDPALSVATVQVPMNDAGPQQVTITIPPEPGEASAENNTATRYVKVLSDRFEVLLVGGAPSWDYRYLRNALARTQWVNARSLLLEPPAAATGPGAGGGPGGGAKGGAAVAAVARLPLAPEQLALYDVIVLCDAPARAFSPEQWEAVRKTVAQHGGSLILLAGRSHLPREYNTEALAEFLPWKRTPLRGGGAGGPLWRVWPGEEPEYRIAPAPGSGLGPSLWLDDAAPDSADRWAALPPVFRYLVLPELKEIAEPVLVERDGGLPVLTRHRLGRGSVFFLGIDETWRWRYKVGERDQDRFFQQLVRAAAGEPYAVTSQALSLDADQIVVAPGQSVRVRARLNETFPGIPYPPGIELDVRDGEGAVVKSVALAGVGGSDSGRYEGAVGGLAEGEYRLRARTPDGAEIEYPLRVTENTEREMANLAPDEQLLARLAASTGGEFRTLDRLKELPGRLAALHQKQPRTAELRLWASWYLYAFVVACLGLEWALRKRFGLA